MKGFVKLIGMMAVLYLPLAIVDFSLNEFDKKSFQETVFFVSASPFWFMRTYIFLYLFSPVLNVYLKLCNRKQLVTLAIILCFISHYCGTIAYDSSLLFGKNLSTFMFLYVVGHLLYKLQHLWKKISPLAYGSIFILYNTIIVLIFTYWRGNLSAILFDKLCFSYCSIGLLLSAVLFFMSIGGINFKSRFINTVAKSSLTIYMIHGANLVFVDLIKPIMNWIMHFLGDSGLKMLLSITLLAFIIVVCCVVIDRLLSPVWKSISDIGERLQMGWQTLKF